MSYVVEHKGKKATLPSFDQLPVGAIRKARNMEPDDQIWFILESVLDAKGMAIIDSMNMAEFTKTIQGWTQGAPLGESLQSSKS
jgi:hypothetical protein